MTVTELHRSDLDKLLGDKNTIVLSSTDAQVSFGAVLGHVESGGRVVVQDGRSGRYRALVSGFGCDTSWADARG